MVPQKGTQALIAILVQMSKSQKPKPKAKAVDAVEEPDEGVAAYVARNVLVGVNLMGLWVMGVRTLVRVRMPGSSAFSSM